MDLSETLLQRTKIDLNVATARALTLSTEIDAAAEELKKLRADLRELQHNSGTDRDQRPARFAPHANSELAQRSTSIATSVRRLFGQKPHSEQLRWHVDEIGGAPPPRDKAGIHARLGNTGAPYFTISGWAVPADGQPPFSEVFVRLVAVEKDVFRNVRTHPRPDVASHFDQADYISCGFRVEFLAAEFPAGTYTLEMTACSADGRRVGARLGTVELTV